jgi:hypothetical protein
MSWLSAISNAQQTSLDRAQPRSEAFVGQVWATRDCPSALALTLNRKYLLEHALRVQFQPGRGNLEVERVRGCPKFGGSMRRWQCKSLV